MKVTLLIEDKKHIVSAVMSTDKIKKLKKTHNIDALNEVYNELLKQINEECKNK